MSPRFRRDDEQVADLRRRMAALRSELDSDIDQVGRSARAMSDWRYYVKRFPWASIAVAAAAGYCIVPKRSYVVSPDPNDLARLAGKERLVVTRKSRSQQPDNMVGRLLALAATGAARAAMSYVGNQLGASTNQPQDNSAQGGKAGVPTNQTDFAGHP